MHINSSLEIRWLHLSDFHFRQSQSWSQDYVLTSLLKSIRGSLKKLGRPDLLFITGDVAFSGKQEEYVLAQEFVLELLKQTGLPSERLFIIPGNHDVDRAKEPDAFVGARVTLKGPTEVDRFLADRDRCATLFKRQKAFRDFANGISPPDNGGYTADSFFHTKCVKIGPIQVNVVLLDSCWLSEGGKLDIGNLLIGDRQVIEASAQCSMSALKFALTHHPLSWLRDFEQVVIENRLLEEHTHVMLRGHVHSSDLRSVEAREKRLTVFTAGAAFESRTADNSYSYCSINLFDGKGTCTTFRYVQSENDWKSNEIESWQLLKGDTPKTSVSTALSVFPETCEFRYFKIALLAGLSGETPCLTDKKNVIWLNIDFESTEIPNPLGSLMRRLRYGVYWKQAFEPAIWKSWVEELNETFDTTLNNLKIKQPQLESDLNDRNHKAKDVIDALDKSADPALSSLQEVLRTLTDFTTSGQWDDWQTTYDHWMTGNVLSIQERDAMQRHKVEALLLKKEFGEANTLNQIMLSTGRGTPLDFYLSAKCNWELKHYDLANAQMHKALDLGIEPSVVKSLALRIAGMTGDKTLVKRVRLNG